METLTISEETTTQRSFWFAYHGTQRVGLRPLNYQRGPAVTWPLWPETSPPRPVFYEPGEPFIWPEGFTRPGGEARKLLPDGLPKGWTSCPMCLFYAESWQRNPGHYQHRSGLSPHSVATLDIPPAKVKGPTIPKCQHGWYDPRGDGSSCSMCGQAEHHPGGARVEGWERFVEERQCNLESKLAEFGLSSAGLDSAWQEQSIRAGYKPKASKSERMRALRRFIDPDELNGFQFRSTRNPNRQKNPPAWVMDDLEFRKYCTYLSTFSAGFDERNNSKKAVACLYLYYRVGMSVPEIAAWIGMDEKAVDNWIARRTKRGDRFFKRLKAKAEGL